MDKTQNKWQKIYLETYVKAGCKERSIKKSKKYELLGQVGEEVTVNTGSKEITYKVTESKCNMPDGLIDVITLSSNLVFWLSRGFKVTLK